MGVGTTTPNPNAVLELVAPANDQGFLVPRVSSADRQSATFTGKLSALDNGLLVFDTDDGNFYFWYNGSWLAVANLNPADMYQAVYDTDGDGRVDSAANAQTVNGLTVETAVPAGAVFTDSQNAILVPYDGSTSGLLATDVQAALDELSTKVVDSANFAFEAGNAIYSDTSSYAYESEHSVYTDTSAYAFESRGAIYSDTSNYAFVADSSGLSEFSYFSDTANFAFESGNALYSDTSSYAFESQHSVYADTSTYAFESGGAIYSDTSNYAFVADSSGLSQLSHYSDTASYAFSAGNSVYADTAVYSDTTRIAAQSIYADTSNYAYLSDSTGLADFANYADTANFSVISDSLPGISTDGSYIGLGTKNDGINLLNGRGVFIIDTLGNLKINDDYHLFHFENTSSSIEGEVITENVYSVGEGLYNDKEEYGSFIYLSDGEIEFLHTDSLPAGTDLLANNAIRGSLLLKSSRDAEFQGGLIIGEHRDSTDIRPGALSFSNTDFTIYNGNAWVNLLTTGDSLIREVGSEGVRTLIAGSTAAPDYSIGFRNVIAGDSAAVTFTSGSYNTFVGFAAAGAGGNASNNTFLGFQSGNSNTANENTFVGSGSGRNNTSGAGNVFMGYRSGYSNGSAINNSFFGYQSGQFNTSSNNTFVGYNSGQNNQGIANTFLGRNAGQFNSTGGNNVFLGNSAGLYNSGSNNIGIGQFSAASSDGLSGGGNTMVGYFTGRYATTAAFNVFMGYQAGQGQLSSPLTGTDNVYIGRQSGYFTTIGSNNVSIGSLSGNSNTSSSFNVFLGSNSGQLTTGGSNTLLGYYAGRNTTSASNNVIIGASAGTTLQTGNGNVLIGRDADVTNSALANSVAIGYQATVSNSNTIVLGRTGTTMPNVGIGTSNPATYLQVNAGSSGTTPEVLISDLTGTTSSDATIEFNNNNGLQAGTYTAGIDATDQNFKISENGTVGVNDRITLVKGTDSIKLNGTVKADEYTYPTDQVRYYTIPSKEFQAGNSASYQINHTTNIIYSFLTAQSNITGDAWAPLHLPHGATITEVIGYVYDNDTTATQTSLTLYFTNMPAETYAVLGSQTAGKSAALQTLTIPLSINVDNSRNAYHLRYRTNAGTGGLGSDNTRLYGVRVTYTVKKSD